MGYTHYITHTEVTPEVWKKILKDCRKLRKNLPIYTDTAGGYFDSVPLILSKCYGGEIALGSNTLGNMRELAFNGFPQELAHETFMLFREGSNGFHFCKTARKPYDLMVCACLIAYTYHSRETMDLGSDGDWNDWGPALEFVTKVLGAEYEMRFRMEQQL